MNIVIVGSAHPLRGGIAVFVERMAEVLMDMGHNVTIYSYALQYPSFLFPGKSQYTDEPVNKRLKIRTVINTVNPLNWIKVGQELRDLSPDVILVKYWMPFFAPALGTIFSQVKKNNHTRIVAILDNLLPHEKRVGDTILSKYFLKNIHGCVAMSQSVLQDLKSMKPEMPAVFAPHPMYDNYGEAVSKSEALKFLGLSHDKNYVLFFGFIRKYKGLDLLLEAFAQPDLRHSNIELIIAGEYYSDEKYYQDIIIQHNLKSKIHEFTNFIPNSEVKYYFSACDLVAQTYKTATQSGISQIAYHFNKPMIVTNVGGLSEIVPHNKVGYVVDGDPESVASSILSAYDDGVMEAFEKGILDEKKKYEWTHFIEKTLDI